MTTPPLPAVHRKRRHATGFTLIEVLVALAILALALVALSQGSSALIRLNERQALLTAAQLCADNALVQARLARTLPAVGDATSDCVQGPQRLQVLVQVRTTPNPSFRRVDAEVRDSFGPLLRASTVVGRT